MRGVRLGRLFGIELRVDQSWILIFCLMSLNLITVFHEWHPAWGLPLAVATGLVGTLVFFGCVVLHELAHSVVARRFGIRVRSITLFLFGGVSDIEHEPPSAKAELVMAFAGPLASIALGMGFAVAAVSLLPSVPQDPEAAMGQLRQMGPFGSLVVWLAPVNLTIGVFNLLPAFPLDGGRVFRAVLWLATGSLRAATLAASVTGQTIGWLLVGSGVAMSFGAHVPLFGTGLGGGIWIAFLGWFIRSAAAKAPGRVALDEAMSGVTVAQLMQCTGPAVGLDLPVSVLMHDYLLRDDNRALPVVDGGVLRGVVGFDDVRFLPPALWPTTTVGSVMQPRAGVPVASPDDPLEAALERLMARDVEQLPVLVGDKLVGMLRRQDVARWIECAWKPFVTQTGGACSGPQESGELRDGGRLTGAGRGPHSVLS